MTAKTNVNYDLRKLSKHVTLNVTMHLTREYKLRRWIATKLILLACLVLGCGIKIDEPCEHITINNGKYCERCGEYLCNEDSEWVPNKTTGK
jgi:hypothetical protein